MRNIFEPKKKSTLEIAMKMNLRRRPRAPPPVARSPVSWDKIPA